MEEFLQILTKAMSKFSDCYWRGGIFRVPTSGVYSISYNTNNPVIMTCYKGQSISLPGVLGAYKIHKVK